MHFITNRPYEILSDGDTEKLHRLCKTETPCTVLAQYHMMASVAAVCRRGRGLPMDFKVVEVWERAGSLLERLVALWERSIRKTHLFLSERYILELLPDVRQAVLHVPSLMVAVDDSGSAVGFMGVDGTMLEMLFIDPDHCGKGIGRMLVEHAVERHRVERVDVNEQNPSALGFYQRMGFRIQSRSELDGQGRPFPILHMRLCGR